MSPKTTAKKETKDLTVTVKAVSKTGSVLGTDGVWYSPSKYAKDLPTFEKGFTYNLKIQENGNFKNIQAAFEVDQPITVTVDGKRAVAGLVAKDVGPETLKPSPFITSSRSYRPNTVTAARDFDKEARGKSRCMLFAAALQSPLVESIEDVINLANAGMRYTFDDKPAVLDAGIPTMDGTVNELEEENPLDSL